MISKEKYRKIINGLELIDIYLINSKSFVEREDIFARTKIRIKNEARYEELEENIVKIFHKYTLIGNSTEKRKKVINIESEFCLVYKIKEGFDEEFFNTFKEINLPVNSWPFFREFVFNITARMNIPPLTIPLFLRTLSRNKNKEKDTKKEKQ
ncbi:MAG: protein-export chaperone SecB [Candidatus Aminicenantes bacterium]|nr:protein-export chaperone SecB [Candidatus Aminicenantes bacterium]